MSLRQLKTVKDRRKYLENKLNLKLDAISAYPLNLDIAQINNCENMIGAISVPLGIAGPLKVNGNYARGEFYIPLATSEGTLVASVNRGCKAISLSGGATAICQDVGITRGSVFMTTGIKSSLKLKIWIENNFQDLKKIASSSSSHLELLGIKNKIVGNYLFVRFSFDTKEAMGMNMASIAADLLVSFIREKTKIYCLSLAGNFDNDKKASYLNFLEGRGRSVFAEVILPESIVKSVLNSTPEKVHQVVKAKCFLGSMISGSLGYNAHYANILAATFIALGQDVAHTAEGSIGITSTEIVDRNLYITVYIPDLPLGTVGGGTHLPAQNEALKILNVTDGKKGEKARQLAEIIGSTVLAGEISLLAALAQGELARSHLKFARNQ